MSAENEREGAGHVRTRLEQRPLAPRSVPADTRPTEPPSAPAPASQVCRGHTPATTCVSADSTCTASAETPSLATATPLAASTAALLVWSSTGLKPPAGEGGKQAGQERGRCVRVRRCAVRGCRRLVSALVGGSSWLPRHMCDGRFGTAAGDAEQGHVQQGRLNCRALPAAAAIYDAPTAQQRRFSAPVYFTRPLTQHLACYENDGNEEHQKCSVGVLKQSHVPPKTSNGGGAGQARPKRPPMPHAGGGPWHLFSSCPGSKGVHQWHDRVGSL